MKPRINNYHDLVVEKQRVQQRLSLLKRNADHEIHEIKQRLRPVGKIVSFIGGKGNGKDTPENKKDSFLKMGANLGMELLVGPKLARAGLLTRLVVPPLLRGITSGLINKFRKKK
jgi:hypothetical protein